MRQYDALVATARELLDVEARVCLLEEAHKLWPTGPNAVELLLKAYLAAAEAALKDNRPKDAANYAGRGPRPGPQEPLCGSDPRLVANEPKILADLARGICRTAWWGRYHGRGLFHIGCQVGSNPETGVALS